MYSKISCLPFDFEKLKATLGGYFCICIIVFFFVIFICPYSLFSYLHYYNINKSINRFTRATHVQPCHCPARYSGGMYGGQKRLIAYALNAEGGGTSFRVVFLSFEL
jgi:hypothetical protein